MLFTIIKDSPGALNQLRGLRAPSEAVTADFILFFFYNLPHSTKEVHIIKYKTVEKIINL